MCCNFFFWKIRNLNEFKLKPRPRHFFRALNIISFHNYLIIPLNFSVLARLDIYTVLMFHKKWKRSQKPKKMKYSNKRSLFRLAMLSNISKFKMFCFTLTIRGLATMNFSFVGTFLLYSRKKLPTINLTSLIVSNSDLYYF